jgi:hypothetical protein
MVWFGGYAPDFIRKFDGFESLSDQNIAEKISWVPLTSKYYWQI